MVTGKNEKKLGEFTFCNRRGGIPGHECVEEFDLLGRRKICIMWASGARPVIQDWITRAELTENIDNKKAPTLRSRGRARERLLISAVAGMDTRNCIRSNSLLARTLCMWRF